MLDLQRLDAGLCDVARFSSAMTRRLSSRSAAPRRVGAEAGADEAAVALQMRQLVDERRAKLRRRARADGAASRQRIVRCLRASPSAADPHRKHRGAAPRRVEPVARWRRDRAGRRVERQPRAARARYRARLRSAARTSLAQTPRRRRRSATASSRASMAAGSVERRRPDARASTRAPAPVTVRSIAASRLPRASPDACRDQLQIGARRRVDRHAAPGACALRRHAATGILPICVSST